MMAQSKEVECPVCHQKVPERYINQHLDNNCRMSFLLPNKSSSDFAAHTDPDSNRQYKRPKKEGLSVYRDAKTDDDGDNDPGDEQIVVDSSPPMNMSLRNTDRPSKQRVSRSESSKSTTSKAKPLAERLRPQQLTDVVGQQHLLGHGMMLRNMIETDQLVSMLLWGPPGTGKTTLARVIAKTTKAAFRELSATSTKIESVRKIFDEASNELRLLGRKTILFVDEVQRFNKSQQDIFLPYIESGKIICMFATTENPSFRIQNALLSRCRVFTLNKLTPEDCTSLLKRAAHIIKDEETSQSQGTETEAKEDVIDESLLQYMANVCDGDARVALQALELAMTAGKDLRKEDLREALKKAHMQYDRVGDFHYDAISALHKSVRGSDPNASLYWLARMLESGEDPLYVARRLVRMAAEDIGVGDTKALPLAVAAYQATERIGMPECDTILAEVAVYLAEAPKSVRVYDAYNRAKSLVKNTPQAYPVPIHLRNAPTSLMKEMGYGKAYRYEPGYAHPVFQEFMPPELKDNADFLKNEVDLSEKTVDWALLREWEWKRQAGARWHGRHKLAELKDEPPPSSAPAPSQ